jgi:hypothetical protein
MPRNLKTLTIAEKQKVLEVVKSGRKKKEIAEIPNYQPAHYLPLKRIVKKLI